jgi:PKD repeat protein
MRALYERNKKNILRESSWGWGRLSFIRTSIFIAWIGEVMVRKIIVILIAAVLLLNCGVLARADSVQHSADSMWLDPSSIVFTAANGTVGQEFNVTVWLNVTENVYSYQVALHYNRTQLMCIAVGYTNGSTSNFFEGHATTSLPPVIDTGFLGNGSILAFETLEGDDMIVGPHCDSLFWAEFQILQVPAAGSSLSSTLDISTEYPSYTWVWDPNLNNVDFTPYDANYLFIGPPPPPLSASITSSSTSIYLGQSVIFSSTVSGGFPPYSYQWCLNSTQTSATSNSWTYTPTNAGSDTVYLNVTDNAGTTAESNSITLTITMLNGPEIRVDPSQITNSSMKPGSTFIVNITAANVASLQTCMFNLTYNPAVLDWTGFDFLWVQGEYPGLFSYANFTAGSVWLGFYYPTPILALSQPLVSLYFYVNAYGISPLNLTYTELIDQNGNLITDDTFNGFFANIIRDVAVTNVVPSANWVYQTWIDNINITVANLGNLTETFNASAWYNTTLIASVPIINLASGAQTTATIPWNTTGVAQGNYIITGTASLVPYETYFNTANNVYVDGAVEVFTLFQDVAVTAVTPNLTWAYANSTVPVNVTVANLGNVSESFNVTAYYGANTTIGTLPVTSLASNTSTVLTFNWNTTGITTEANYTLSAFASYVPSEYNLTNNYLVGGQVLLLTRIRDVAITNVTAASYWAANWAYQGANMNVTVTANDTGQVSESFYVSAFCNTTLLGNVSVNLAPGTGAIEVFTLNTTTLPVYQNLTVSAQASIVQYEYNVSNNVYVGGNVTVRYMGDVNGDGKVDGRDLTLIAKAYGSYGPGYLYAGSPPSSTWNILCDLNCDNKVDGKDETIADKNFGEGG